MLTEANHRRLATQGDNSGTPIQIDDYSGHLNSIIMPKTGTPEEDKTTSSRVPAVEISKYSN